MDVNRKPGYYELVYDYDSFAIILATLIAKRFERALWLFSVAMMDDMSTVARAGDGSKFSGRHVGKISETFSVVQEQGANFDVIVIDDLSSLLPDHSGSRHVAKSIQRAVVGWEPKVPVLVLNQARNPAPVGGLYWRQRCISRTLKTIHDGDPLLLSWLQEGPGARFLIWYPWRGPQFRRLSHPEQVVLLRGLDCTQHEMSGGWIV